MPAFSLFPLNNPMAICISETLHSLEDKFECIITCNALLQYETCLAILLRHKLLAKLQGVT